MRIAVRVWWLAISAEGNLRCHIFTKFLTNTSLLSHNFNKFDRDEDCIVLHFMRLNYAEGFVCVEDLLVFLIDSIIDFDGI
jgi:hypothetical protein